MKLVAMMALDKNALICDLAETYHIYDYRRLTVQQLAVFSLGLDNRSRIKRKMQGITCDLDEMYYALIIDSINSLTYAYALAHGGKQAEKPVSIYNSLVQRAKKKASDIRAFDSIEAYEAYRKRKRETNKGG